MPERPENVQYWQNSTWWWGCHSLQQQYTCVYMKHCHMSWQGYTQIGNYVHVHVKVLQIAKLKSWSYTIHIPHGMERRVTALEGECMLLVCTAFAKPCGQTCYTINNGALNRNNKLMYSMHQTCRIHTCTVHSSHAKVIWGAWPGLHNTHQWDSHISLPRRLKRVQ